MRIKLIILLIAIALLFYSCKNNDSDSLGKLELKTSSAAQPLNQVSTIGSEIGNAPIDFTVVTTDGKAVRLNDFTENKMPVLVYFMATWCPWCAQDYAALSKVYRGYESNVSILSISLDLNDNINALKEYKKKYPELKSTMFAPGQSKILVDYRVTKLLQNTPLAEMAK